jgi:hypothetical protein
MGIGAAKLMSTTTIFKADPNTKRQCGGCTLCCKLTPVKSMNKDAGERCKHQRTGKGCAIYARRPMDCATWFCRWLINDDTADLSRPDRAGYVIDMMPDYVTIRDNTGKKPPQHIPCLQIWVDPHRREAHRDPALRRYMERSGERGFASLIRFDQSDGFIVFPPSMTADRQWHEERPTNNFNQRQHSTDEVFRVLAGGDPNVDLPVETTATFR